MSQATKSDETPEILQEEVAIHSSLTPEPGLTMPGEGEPEAEAENLPKLRPLIFNRDYMLLWSGQVISGLGSGISGIVFPLLILAITTDLVNPQGNTVIAGIAGALGSLPYLLFSLPAGALIDRWNRKHVMMICDAFRALNSATIPLAIFLDGLTIWQLLINAFIEGCFFVFFNIAEVAALPRVVDRRQLPQASAQNEGGGIAAGLAGPPLGTFLFQSVSQAFPFLLDAISYAVSVFSLGLIKTEFQGERHNEDRHLLVEIREGMSWLWHQPLIRFMAFLTGGLNLVNSGTFLVLIVLAKQLGAEDYQIGFMVSIGALGGIVGAAVGGTIQKRFTFGQVIITVGWIATILYGFYIFAPNFIVLGILMALS